MKTISYNYNSGPIFFKTSNFGIADNEGTLETLPRGTQITITGSGDQGNSAGNIWIQTGKSETHRGSGYILLRYNDPINTGISCSSDDLLIYTYWLPDDLAVKIYCSDIGNEDKYDEYFPIFHITLNKDAMATILDVVDLNGGVYDDLLDEINDGLNNKLINKNILDILISESENRDPMMYVSIKDGTNYSDTKCIKYSDLQIVPTETSWTKSNIVTGNSISLCPSWTGTYTVSCYILVYGPQVSYTIDRTKLTPYSIKFQGKLKSGNTLLRSINITANSYIVSETFSVRCQGNLNITDITAQITWKSANGSMYTSDDTILSVTVQFDITP